MKLLLLAMLGLGPIGTLKGKSAGDTATHVNIAVGGGGESADEAALPTMPTEEGSSMSLATDLASARGADGDGAAGLGGRGCSVARDA